jgi:hypothetical protein
MVIDDSELIVHAGVFEMIIEGKSLLVITFQGLQGESNGDTVDLDQCEYDAAERAKNFYGSQTAMQKTMQQKNV